MGTGTDLDRLSINTIRFLSVDAVQKANSGHPGLPLGSAPMAYVLWKRYLKFNPHDPKWWDRDRFVLSAGHGSMLLYSLLYLTGYDLPLEQLKQFRQFGSMTPGHPERGFTPGVETTTGPLGQGFANAVGMAMAEAFLAARYNRPGYEIVNHYTYALVSDGDLMEGVSHEAGSYAGHMRLGKIIFLYDNNHISLASSTQVTYTEDRAKRFEAYGWHVQMVDDGNDLDAIDRAIANARGTTDRPSIIMVRTIIGYGAPHKENTFEVHGSPLGPDEVKATKENLDWPLEPTFYVPEQALKNFREAVPKGEQAQAEWNKLFAAYEQEFPDLAKEFKRVMNGELPSGWDKNIPSFPADAKGIATRVASGQVMNAIAPHVPNFMGGSADLNPSTHTALKGLGDFEPPEEDKGDTQGKVGGGWDYAGRNIHWGVREHAMGSASNGLWAHGGIIPFTGTFLAFADYMRPPIRLAAIMEAHVIFVFTHDSIGLGEDGPTHQPVGQLASLRAIPQLTTIRPSDANETAVAWKVAMEAKGPVVLVFTRQNVPTLDRTKYAPAEGLRKGAYVLADPPDGKSPQVILIATGSEVSLIVEAQRTLKDQGIAARIVSMPSWELFDAQQQQYRDSVLPPDVTARVAVEAGVPMGWDRYVGLKGSVIGVNRFGASAPYKVVFEKYGFTPDHVAEEAKKVLKK